MNCASGRRLCIGLFTTCVPLILGLALLSRGSAQDNQQSKAGPIHPEDTAEVHLGWGHEKLKNGRYLEAAREFGAALTLNPQLGVRAEFPLAVALFNPQDVEQARREFELVRSKTGDNPNVAYYLGRLDLMEGKVDSAIRNLTLAVADPPFPDTAYYLGYAYIKKRDMTQAEKWLHKAAELAPRDFRVQERLGLLYRLTGRKEEAEKAFALSDRLHQQDTEATAIALECGHALDTRPLLESRGVCQRLFDPEDTGKLVTLGTFYGQHRDYAEALEPFRRAAELAPDSYEMQYNLGLTYFRLKRYAEARAPLEKAVELRPDMFETTGPLGAALYALGDDAAAYKVLGRAYELRPENVDISELLFKLALSLSARSSNQKDYGAARRYLLKASEVRPNDPDTHRRLAEVYDLLGDKSKTVKERELAQRLEQASH